MCMLLYIESYICICVCMFSHYTEFLILYIIDKCEFYQTRALFVRSHQVSSSTWFCLRWLVSAGAAVVVGQATGGSWAETKQVRNVNGHILDVRSCKSFLELLAGWCRNVKRPISSDPIVIWAEALRAVTPMALLLSWVLTGWLQCCHCYYLQVFRGWQIKLTALSFCVPFCKLFIMKSWITALLCFFLYFFLIVLVCILILFQQHLSLCLLFSILESA